MDFQKINNLGCIGLFGIVYTSAILSCGSVALNSINPENMPSFITQNKPEVIIYLNNEKERNSIRRDLRYNKPRDQYLEKRLEKLTQTQEKLKSQEPTIRESEQTLKNLIHYPGYIILSGLIPLIIGLCIKKPYKK